MTGILNLIIGSLGQRYTIIQTFTATQDWTCPAGVTEVDYLVVAGGGGGGGVLNTTASSGTCPAAAQAAIPCFQTNVSLVN